MVANVGNPSLALSVYRRLVGAPGLEIVIAHQIHVVFLRLLLRSFGNRQQHKNRDRKVSFHMRALLYSLVLRFCRHNTPKAFAPFTIAVHCRPTASVFGKRIIRKTVEPPLAGFGGRDDRMR